MPESTAATGATGATGAEFTTGAEPAITEPAQAALAMAIAIFVMLFCSVV
jgi:hypothetical protein